ncbi:MAG: haloacid dehalogenase-like hydrolase [Clostridia bacterium]|nr:haloacid dehalogenase-like hydrolase [Clostridia bacterium]
MNVFDFDNTIYRGESFVDLFVMVLKKDPTLLRNVPHMVSGVLQYKLGTLRLEKALEKYAGIFEEYVSGLDNLDDLVNEFWDKHIHKVKPFYSDVRSEDDIVISASPEIVIAEVCRRIGIKNYVGTKYDVEKGKLGMVCFRENKIKAFYERYPDGKIDTLYTDSMHDKPLMDISDKVFFVTGDRIKRIK